MKKLFRLYLIVLVSCSDVISTEVNTTSLPDTIQHPDKTDTVSPPQKKDTLGIMFDNARPFEIVSFKKEATLKYSGPDDTSVCSSWNIKKDDLHRIFMNSEPINGTTWDLAFAFSSCEAKGQLKQNGELFNYSVNAGSWFWVTCRDTGLIFGDYNIRDRKFFLDSVERH